MRPGPSKKFDPEIALVRARDLFWEKGYAGTAISELESTLGVGRKSLYDTFGGKRRLYLRTLEQYTESVIGRICKGLEDPRNDAFSNLERVLHQLQEHHASKESLGCMLGVAMAQADPEDEELSEVLQSYLKKLERAFERNIRCARNDGAIREAVRPKDAARHLVALTQGMALMARVTESPAVMRSIVRSSLDALRH